MVANKVAFRPPCLSSPGLLSPFHDGSGGLWGPGGHLSPPFAPPAGYQQYRRRQKRKRYNPFLRAPASEPPLRLEDDDDGVDYDYDHDNHDELFADPGKLLEEEREEEEEDYPAPRPRRKKVFTPHRAQYRYHTSTPNPAETMSLDDVPENGRGVKTKVFQGRRAASNVY